MSNGPILVVDDDPAIRAVVTDVLEDEGYAVLTATDGQEGLAVLAQTTPELILLDMRMPGLDGWGFARIAQSQGALRPSW